jgi:hypothetical protein
MGKLNDIRFTKTNGGMGRTAASKDPVSGLVMYLPDLAAADLINSNNARQFDTIEDADGTNDLYVAKLRCKEDLEDYGFPEWERVELSMSKNSYTASSEAAEFKKNAAKNAIVYHVTKFFEQNAEGTLYLAVKIAASSHVLGADLKALQNYTNGEIRQCGVFTPSLTYTTGIEVLHKLLDEYQDACNNSETGLEAEHKPMSVIMTVTGKTVTVGTSGDNMTVTPVAVTGVALTDFTTNTANDKPIKAGRCNVSLLIGCDLDTTLVQMLGNYAYYGCIGTCMGAISKAAVNESIAWVQKFPLGLEAPGLISGELIKDLTTANLEAMNDNRYIFVLTHVGDADNYFNDSHTLDVETSDYAYIENVRTIDKACRGVRANLLPYLNAPLKVDAETGKLDAPMVAFLETTAGKALEDMEKAGELSGYKAEIDPEQNVLATSSVEIVIKQVPVGVMRKINVKIGFSTKLS